MKKLLIVVLAVVIVVVFVGAYLSRDKYVELDRVGFSELDFYSVKEVRIIASPAGQEVALRKWQDIDVLLCPIKDPLKIDAILRCIRESDVVEHDPHLKMLFVTEDVIYYIGFSLRHDKSYGDWWESEELCSLFQEWRRKIPIYDSSNNENVKLMQRLAKDPNSVLFRQSNPDRF